MVTLPFHPYRTLLPRSQKCSAPIMQIYAPLNSEPYPLLQKIEVATFFQIPSFQIIGLPSPEVAEARERVRSAIEASGMEFPRRRVILNLSPASIRKRGTGLDLAMGLAVLAIESKSQTRLAAWGELGLDGTIKPAGQLTRTLYATWKGKLPYLVLSELEYLEGLRAIEWIRQGEEMEGECPRLLPVSSLNEAWEIISASPKKTQKLERRISFLPASSTAFENSTLAMTSPSALLLPLSPALERMMGIAAAGRHHLLLLGPRGTGKSQALEWLIALQPPMAPADFLKQSLLAEMGRTHPSQSAIHQTHVSHSTTPHSKRVPIRRLSSQVRPAALVGNATATWIRPGEFSLAHGGLLVADELPEWHRDSRESLREPLERGRITLSRVNGAIDLPARFQLAASGNLCPCGGWPPELPLPNDTTDDSAGAGVDTGGPGSNRVGNDGRARSRPSCQCTYSARKNYLARLSGPILDRIDLVAPMTGVDLSSTHSADLSKSPGGLHERLEALRKRVVETRTELMRAWGGPPGVLSASEVETLIQKNFEWNAEIAQLSSGSLRSKHKIVRIALSLSVWDGSPAPNASHFMEASFYRPEKFLFFNPVP